MLVGVSRTPIRPFNVNPKFDNNCGEFIRIHGKSPIDPHKLYIVGKRKTLSTRICQCHMSRGGGGFTWENEDKSLFVLESQNDNMMLA